MMGGVLVESGHRPKACTEGQNDGDTFVILGINLPQSYITNAEEKLEAEIIKYLQDNNDEKFTFSINFSRIYFEENPDVLDYLNENSRINVVYNGRTYLLYVTSFSYYMGEGDVLPEIRVELDDSLTVSQNALQNAINQVKGDMGRALSNIDVVGLATPYFLRKDADDEAQGKINFVKGIKFGEGGKVEVLDNNSAKLTIEYLEVTKKASFTSLEIKEKTHVGGQIIISPAAMTCGEVEELEDVYRCYFQTRDENGSDEIFNQFVVNDLAICQTYNEWGSRYYWRKVVGIGEDYIDLSKTLCDEYSDAPMAGDKIVQLGNTEDTTRQAAQVLSAYGEDAPSFIMYNGVNGFSLEGKNITGIIWNPETQEPQMYSYGSFFFGDRQLQDNFITFQKREGDNEKTLSINADVHIGANSSGLTNLSEWAEKQAEIDANKAATEAVARELLDTKDEFDQSILEINNKLDGVVESYFFKYSPSRTNEPALTWINEGTEADHVGDTFTNVSLDGEDAGKSWRWLMQDDSTYDWNPIADSDAAKALALAGQAKATADGKTTIFIAKPNREYFEGDTWIVGEDYIPRRYKVGDILTSSRHSQVYIESDWSKQVRYTDDSTLWAWSENNVISPMHHQALREEMERIYYEYESIRYNVQRYGLDEIDEWTAYEDAYSDYYQDLDYLVTSQNAETASFLSTFRDTYYNKKTAILDAIDAAAKQGVDDLAYLKSTFDTVVEVDGVVLGEMVAVRDEITGDVDAFLNGSTQGIDDTHGKLLIAAGIDDIEKPEEAKTRVYEDGTIVIDAPSVEGKVILSDNGLVYYSTRNGTDAIRASLGGNCAGASGLFIADGASEPTYCTNAAILALGSDVAPAGNFRGRIIVTGVVDARNEGIWCEKIESPLSGTLEIVLPDDLSSKIQMPYGKFEGLRPATRVISTTGSSTSPNVLTDLDYSVLVNLTSGTTYIRLPQTPQDGQEYHIETKGADVVLLSTKLIFSHKDNRTDTTFTVASRGVFRMKYYAGINQWTFCWIDSY